jgi:hypothetical protein
MALCSDLTELCFVAAVDWHHQKAGLHSPSHKVRHPDSEIYNIHVHTVWITTANFIPCLYWQYICMYMCVKDHLKTAGLF